jgi:hypothetical protein
VNDKSLDWISNDAVAETHPARKAMDILTATDEYRDNKDSARVAMFFINELKHGRLKNLFHNILDDMARLRCFKQNGKRIRKEVSDVLIDLVEKRLSNVTNSSTRQVGKVLEKLSPDKCGDDSEKVARFVERVAKYPALFEKAVMLLGCLRSPYSDDAFIRILKENRSQTDQFISVLPWALGLKGRKLRPRVLEYLEEIFDRLPKDLQPTVSGFFDNYTRRKNEIKAVL